MAITPYMTKSGKRYRVEVYREGERFAAKAGFTTQQDAKKWEARTLVRAEKQAPTGTDFLRLATAYLDDMKERRQHNTVQYKIAALRRFLSFMGGRFSLELLRSSQISAYLVARKNAIGPSAANRDLVELRAIMNSIVFAVLALCWTLALRRVYSLRWPRAFATFTILLLSLFLGHFVYRFVQGVLVLSLL